MGNNWLFLIDPDGSSSGLFPMDPFLPHNLGSQWLSSVYVPGSLVLQEALNCMSKFAGAIVIWFASGSNSNISRKLPGDHFGSHSRCSTTSVHVKHISSVRHDLTGFSRKSKQIGGSAIPVVFNKIARFAMKHLCKEVQRLQSFPMLSLAAAIVPPVTNISSKMLAMPVDISSAEPQRDMDQKPCDVESRGCGPCSDLYLQNLAWAKTIEPRTGIEFPTMLDNNISGESNSSFTPEVLVGTGSRTMTIIRIKSLKIYAFGFYVHPFDVCEKLGQKYACIPEYELKNHREFYRDLLREDISMTVRLVINCNGIKINTVKDVFEKALRARLTRTNPEADFSCLEKFGSVFSEDIPLREGTTINIHRTSDGHLITEGECQFDANKEWLEGVILEQSKAKTCAGPFSTCILVKFPYVSRRKKRSGKMWQVLLGCVDPTSSTMDLHATKRFKQLNS